MKERGIIFCQDLIPGVMAGTVTVTSRVIKPQPLDIVTFLDRESQPTGEFGWCSYPNVISTHIRAPYRVGERRYVKETLYVVPNWGTVSYAADAVTLYDPNEHPRSEAAELLIERHGDSYFANDKKLVPSMFMPRWAARTWVEILSVKPARCQEIDVTEILASGVACPGRDAMLAIAPIDEASDLAHTRNAYAALWDRLNKRRGYPWSASPWVWRVTFRTAAP